MHPVYYRLLSPPAQSDQEPVSHVEDDDERSKHIIIIVHTAYGPNFQIRWAKFLERLNREVNIYVVVCLQGLDFLLETYGPHVSGIVVADDSITQPCYDELSARLVDLVSSGEKLTVTFGLDLAIQVAFDSYQFEKYLKEFFGLEWKVAGMSANKSMLKLGLDALPKLAPRVFRSEYNVRCTFLRNVYESDKVLVTMDRASPERQLNSDDEEESTDDSLETLEFGLGDEEEQDDQSSDAATGAVDAAPATTPSSGTSSLVANDSESERGSTTFSPIASDSTEATDTDVSEGFVAFFHQNLVFDFLAMQNEILDANPDWVWEAPDANQMTVDNGEAGEANTTFTLDEGYATDISTASSEAENSGDEADDEHEDGSGDDSDSSDLYDDNVYDAFGEYLGSGNANASNNDANDDEQISDYMLENSIRSGYVSSDFEGTEADRLVANSPVTIHGFRASEGSPECYSGFVAFLGHAADNRSFASILLAMCGVRRKVYGAEMK